MIIFLLTFLAVALVIIFVGFLLSPRSSHTPTRSRISYAEHVGHAGRSVKVHRASGGSVAGARKTRSLRASRALEKRSGGHALALMDVRGLFSPHIQQTPWLGLALILVFCCLTGVFLL